MSSSGPVWAVDYDGIEYWHDWVHMKVAADAPLSGLSWIPCARMCYGFSFPARFRPILPHLPPSLPAPLPWSRGRPATA